ncbi:hypothetical protein [Methanocrinis sp.]
MIAICGAELPDSLEEILQETEKKEMGEKSDQSKKTLPRAQTTDETCKD